jgi:hypothetical protein
MTLNLSISRQRIPMVDASTLEDRTRPMATSGSSALRLRYFQWPSWSAAEDQDSSRHAAPSQARLGRR